MNFQVIKDSLPTSCYKEDDYDSNEESNNRCYDMTHRLNYLGKKLLPSCYERLRDIQYLGPVILQKDEEVPHDYDNWKQCYKCGRKYTNSEVKRESKIDDIVEEVEPDSSSSSEVQPVAALRYDSRRKGKGRLQRFRDKQNMSRRKIKDPEAIAAIKKGLKVTN